MDRFEQRLRAARPEVPPLGPDFAAQVCAEIERRGLRVWPAWRVRGGLWLGRTAALAALVAAVLVLNGAAYELRSSGALELLHFGGRLLSAFVERLPWDLLASALLLGAGAAWGIRHTRLARVSVAWAVLISYGLTGAGGLALASSGLNESLQEAVLKEDVGGPALSWFYGERAVYRRPAPRFLMGRVLALEGERARLQTPLGDEATVTLPPGFRAQVGDTLRLLEAREDATAGAVPRTELAQLCNPAAVGGYFRHHQMMRQHMRGGPMMAPGMGPAGPMMGPGMGPAGPGGRMMGPGMGAGGPMMGPGMGRGGPMMGTGGMAPGGPGPR